jgi:hypothetical protein
MNHPVFHISLIVLGFYYGALFIYLAPGIFARFRVWFSGERKNKRDTSSPPQRRHLNVKEVFMAHWVAAGETGSNVFSLQPYKRQYSSAN